MVKLPLECLTLAWSGKPQKSRCRIAESSPSSTVNHVVVKVHPVVLKAVRIWWKISYWKRQHAKSLTKLNIFKLNGVGDGGGGMGWQKATREAPGTELLTRWTSEWDCKGREYINIISRTANKDQ
jgi:hypothetical protein